MNQKASATFSRVVVAISIWLGTSAALAQMVDLNGNGMSDVWEWVYAATSLTPNADADGDGVSNLKEALAGTNPFDSNSIPKISAFTVSATNSSITMPAQLGKLYQLQSLSDLGSTNWLVETSTVVRAGTTVTFPSLPNPTIKFYRVAISDVDSDGDGLSDWEEYKLGLDPSNAMSNATLDGFGNALTDYQYAASKLPAQNVITISATDLTTIQPDPGQSATDLAVFTVTRGGFPLNLVTVNLTLGGPGGGYAASGQDYLPLSTLVSFPAGTSTKNISVVPLANTNLTAPVIVQLKVMPGANYLVGSQSNASVVIYPSATVNGTGLLGQYFTNANLTYANATNFNATNLFLTRVDTNIDFTWTNGISPNLSNGVYCVRWTGQVVPQYSENYFFDVVSDDGVKLWVNDQLLIDKWQVQNGGLEFVSNIVLQAGIHYDLKMEYLQYTNKAQAHLYWYCADQSRQIIPNSRLYPTNSFSSSSTSNAPAAIMSALNAFGFVGQPFAFTNTGANTPLRYTATNLPPGLIFNPTNGVINGTPTLAGDYQVPLTASNAVGVGASVLDILIFNNSNSIVREIWTNVPGINIADIPLATPANVTNVFAALEGTTDFGDNYGERARGFFTAPVTGNYYFWIAGSDSAQLWISDDGEAVNKVLRAWVTPTNNPTAPILNGTTSRQWNLQSSQKSGWLALNAGQNYYIEVLHKAGVGTNDNWAVGWLQDPTGTNATAAGVTPSYLLSRYYPPLPATISGTLYTANMLALPGISSSAVGSATLRVSANGSQAILNYSINNLAGAHIDHIYSDPYLNNPTTLLFDIAAAHPQADGSYLWRITPTGALSTNDIIEIINQNKCSIVIQTPGNPAGEIGGHFTPATGSQTFNPPPAPPLWADDSADPNAADRFLIQATYGPSLSDIAAVQAQGYTNWINNQFLIPPTYHLPIVVANKSANPATVYPSSDWFGAWWQNAVTSPDQLRQRVAFALSEIMVVSESGTLQDRSDTLSSYYDTLLDNCFGNFRALLKAVTLTPAMGLYLNMQANDKGNIVTGTHANENYGREINQLFSIGLNRLWPDGTLILNSAGNLVPTYNQNVINGFAATFTGWNYFQTNQANGRLPSNFGPSANYTNPMVLVPTHHDLNAKLILDNVTLPPAQGNAANSALTNYDYYASQDLEQALDNIFNNQNVGPFICRQLIQRLVTANPSRDYLYRVTQVFNDNGSGVRGDLQAVVKAILLDYEARSTNLLAAPTYGKQREPLLRVTALARAFTAPPTTSATYAETGTQLITITTTNAHRLATGGTVVLNFTDTSGQPAPPTQSYTVTYVGTNSFTVNCPNVLGGTYTQTNGVITINMSGHGLAAGNLCYLVFATGGATTQMYQVVSAPNGNVFTVATSDNTGRAGNCVMPKVTTAGYVQSGQTVNVSCAAAHGLVPNELFYIPANGVLLPAGFYQVITVPDTTHFTFLTTSNNTTQGGFNLYPLGSPPPPLTRSGTANLQWSTWNLGYTDSGTTYNLAQSPLSANTVFNFFFPNYAFPGALAAAGLTTPEFQLTSDTSVALQMNFLASGFVTNSVNNANNINTNGFSSFTAGDGSILMDLGAWMTTNYTAAANVPVLVDNFNSLLLAGQLSAAAKTNIVNYVTNTVNFPFSTPPTAQQMRERVRAVAHLIANSPDFTIQK